MRDVKPDRRAQTPVMLVIGNMDRWRSAGRVLPEIENCHLVQPTDLTAETLAKSQPDFVVSALIGPGCDALEIAQTLVALNFQGAYRVISESLPNSDNVRSEIRQAAPGLDFDIYEV